MVYSALLEVSSLFPRSSLSQSRSATGPQTHLKEPSMSTTNREAPILQFRQHSATVKHRVELDFVRFKARTFKDDIRIFHGKPNWNAASDCYCQMAQCILFPNILWVVLMNSAVFGIYVVMVTEFGGIFVAPPYNFPFTSLGFIQGGQIIVSILLVSILGWGGDHLTRVMAKGNNGLSEPEYRLIPILLPAVIVVTRCVRFAPYRLVTLGHHHHLQRRILWFYRYCIDRVHLFPQLLR
jgi:hypothetical protein